MQMTRAGYVGALAAVLLAAGVGCSKETESLVVVTATPADGTITDLDTLIVTVGKTSQTYALSPPLTTAGVKIGIYVPQSVTGSQSVTAIATHAAGCGQGYEGKTSVTIGKAGDTVSVSVPMTEQMTCPLNSGSTGTGGTGGSMGTGGGAGSCTAQAQPAVGTPPAFQCCIEYDQDAVENCDSTSGTQVNAVAFSPDGKTFVSAASDGGNNVKIWSFDGHTLTATGKVLASDGFSSLAFSADGATLAVAVSGGVDLWATATWTRTATLTGNSSNNYLGVAFAPDQTHIIAIDEDSTTNTGNLYVFQFANPPVTVAPLVTVPLTDDPDFLAVAPKAVNGSTGVVVAYTDGYADVYSYASGAFLPGSPIDLMVDPDGFNAWSAAFDATGTKLAIGDDDGGIHFWTYPLSGTAETSPEIMFGTSGDDSVYALVYSPNGSYLAAGGGSLDSDSNVSLFKLSTQAQIARANSSHDVTSLAFSPGGNAVGGGEVNCGKVFMCTN